MVFAIVVVSGCDYVFSIDKHVLAPAPCGPYETVTPVSIEGVTEPRQFSIRETDTEHIALVVGKDSNGVTRPIPLMWSGSVWVPDPALQGALDNSLAGANLSPAEPIPVLGSYTGATQPAMLAWGGTPQQLGRYFWTGTGWDQDKNQLPLTEPEYEVRAGNVVVVAGTGGPNDRVRHTVVVELALEASLNNRVLLHANTAPSFTLSPKLSRTLPLNELVSGIGQAVLADDQAKLVYSATVANTDRDLYASQQDGQRTFAEGGPVAGVNTRDDEVEPWINETCSKLYFRRTPAGQPNDPGTIYVAE